MSVAFLHRLNAATVVNISLDLSDVRPQKSKSKTKPWDEKIKEITSVVCALFNSCYGGVLRLSFDEQCSAIKTTEPKTIDDMVRRIEQSLINFAGIATVSSAFKLQDTSTGGLEFIVKPAPKFCTVEYNLYLPSDYQVSPITFGDCPAKIATLLQPPGKTFMVSFKEHCKKFTHKEKVPGGLRESQTDQFKLLKDDPTSNFTLADRVTSKQNKLTAHVSAFANHDGGNLYFGVDDTTYIVQGQVANRKEQEKIRKRVSNVLSKMVWPDKSHQRFWRIEFVPVCERDGAVRQDTFVIVLSVAKCPGGVFVEEPESYLLENNGAVRVPLPLWKEKIRADARGCGDSFRCLDSSSALVPTTCIYKRIGAKGWRKPSDEVEYMKFTQFMENLRNNGNWKEIDEIAARVLTPQNNNADLKLAVTFQCTAAAYRQNKYDDAYRFLASYHELVRQAKNPAIFEVQELYSWSAIKRSERDYQESYRYAYDALQKMQFIVPGWITAWFLCNAASLLTMFASEESDPQTKRLLTGAAECYYRQALEHAQTIVAYKKAAANLRHRVHINLAMLYLDSSPNINIKSLSQTVSPECLKSAQESLTAAENLEGSPMTGFNEFYFLLAKSDLYLRYFQHAVDGCAEYMKKAIRYANEACKVATDNDFAEVLHYAQSRIRLLKEIPLKDENVIEQVDELLRNINL